MEKKYRYIFGPVPSRRLGRSLGIDLVPFKNCSYNCIYCQIGETTDLVTVPREFFPVTGIETEIERRLQEDRDFDCVTFSGSGEPLLYAGIGRLIEFTKERTEKPVVLITNSSLLGDPAAAGSAKKVDILIPSLDAGNQRDFERINRPVPGITFSGMLECLAAFSRGYRGRLWLEIFLAAGLNDSEESVRDIKLAAEKICYEKIQLNTVVRPPALSGTEAVTSDRLEEIAEYLPGTVEIIAPFRDKGLPGRSDVERIEECIIELLKRRPCSVEDIAGGLALHRLEVLKYFEDLINSGKIEKIRVSGDRDFFQIIR